VVRFQVGQGGGDSIQLVEQFVSCQAVHDVSAGYMHRGLRHEVILLVVDGLVMLLVVCQRHPGTPGTPGTYTGTHVPRTGTHRLHLGTSLLLATTFLPAHAVACAYQQYRPDSFSLVRTSSSALVCLYQQ
jgi:hypothetical protein